MGVVGKTLCCECERALSVQMNASNFFMERQARCSEMYVAVLRCHCRLSELSLLPNVESLPARALERCLTLLFRTIADPRYGEKKPLMYQLLMLQARTPVPQF